MSIESKNSISAVCPNCGKEIQTGSKFCKECGAKIDVSDEKSTEESVNTTTEENSVQSKSDELLNNATKSKKKSVLILVGIIALVVSLVVATFLNLFNTNKNSNETTLRTSPDKYTWYVKNYVGKNCASFGKTSWLGHRYDTYGDAEVKLILIAEDDTFVDPEDEEMLKQYKVTKQNINPNTVLKLTFKKDDKGKELDYIESQSIEEIELKVKSISGRKNKKESASSSDNTSEGHSSTDKNTKAHTIVKNTNNTKNEGNEFSEGAYRCKNLSDGTIELIKYTGEDTSVNLPSKIGNKEVTKIGDNAFKGCTFLDEVDIPESVLIIGNSAFEDCTNLTEVYIWGDIKSFGDRSFKNCKSLSEVDIPSATESIGDSAFENCTSVEDIYFWGGKRIGNSAFKNCTSLKSLNIDGSVESLGDHAFYGCTSLEEVTIWSEDTAIGNETFGNCPKATIEVF